MIQIASRKAYTKRNNATNCLDCFKCLIVFSMILVKITNSSEIVASKTHKLFAKVTPEKIDENLVESEVIKQMGDDLASFGLKGEISIVKGINIQNQSLVTQKGFVVKKHKNF